MTSIETAMVWLDFNADRKETVRQPVLENSSGGRLDVVSDEAEFELWDSHFMLRGDHEPDLGNNHKRWGPRGWCKPSCIPISIILVLIVLVVLLPLLDQAERLQAHAEQAAVAAECSQSCRLSLVESIPVGLVYDGGATPHPSTFHTWMNLINMAESSIKIASFYWTLRASDVYNDPSAAQGEEVFTALLKAGTERKINVHIAQNYPTQTQQNLDTAYLAKKGAAEVRSLNFPRLLGGGVLHTKFWIVDDRHLYVGSANMDWRSLTQVKELGAVVYNCTCIVSDALKLFDVYWSLGEPGAVIPAEWPANLSTVFNIDSPMNISFNGSEVQTYLGSSPPAFCPEGRSTDLTAVLNVIASAEKFIYIAVMDYIPMTIYTAKRRFWPLIDDALRAAAIDDRVHVRLLISHWNHSQAAMGNFLQSTARVSNAYPGVSVEVRLFVVPSNEQQSKIPYTRVNHNKYMVTDNTAYIGTSNWSGDYFVDTAGASLVVKEPEDGTQNQSSVRAQLQSVFERDWNSAYARPLEDT
ncbi:5'-3' exonuclease PLD3-like isoform X2 [Bacillus rossius redtenbacheri]|uniref:5'-3' exonuclease PLD3-like isoform X2 n=1 Tax=Bacillus rossius redtenbacheri TaxID=93214 RepID=UPI002FDDDFE8